MILDTQIQPPLMKSSQKSMQAPPSYDAVIQDSYTGTQPFDPKARPTESPAHKIQPAPLPASSPSPANVPGPYFATAGPTVYHYLNPRTGDHITSYLPPDHPHMVCLQTTGHQPKTKFGLLGILCAIVWFPLGVVCCLADRKIKCKRCGIVLDEGIL